MPLGTGSTIAMCHHEFAFGLGRKDKEMKSIEEVIDNIVDEHKECRWMDASELRKYLEEVAKAQKVVDIEKTCEWVNDNKQPVLASEIDDTIVGYSIAVEEFIEWLKTMEE